MKRYPIVLMILLALVGCKNENQDDGWGGQDNRFVFCVEYKGDSEQQRKKYYPYKNEPE